MGRELSARQCPILHGHSVEADVGVSDAETELMRLLLLHSHDFICRLVAQTFCQRICLLSRPVTVM